MLRNSFIFVVAILAACVPVLAVERALATQPSKPGRTSRRLRRWAITNG